MVTDIQVWWGEAPDRSVSGCGELSRLELLVL